MPDPGKVGGGGRKKKPNQKDDYALYPGKEKKNKEPATLFLYRKREGGKGKGGRPLLRALKGEARRDITSLSPANEKKEEEGQQFPRLLGKRRRHAWAFPSRGENMSIRARGKRGEN